MRKTPLFIVLAFMLAVVILMSGCNSLSETAQKVSDDLGDKALQAHAFIDIWKVETSDATANGSPTGKKITVIGDVKSIPLTSKTGELVKDYGEYRKTETPAWYNSQNVTKEEVLILTGDNAKEFKTLLLQKAKNITDSSPDKETSDAADIID